MFVIISGHVAITQRDGLGHVTPVVDQGPGQFLAEVGTLSGRPALVDGHAEGDVEALVIEPEDLRRLLVAEAELGERIVRALILRRVGLIETDASGPVLIGSPDVARRRPAADFSPPQRPAASRARPRDRSGGVRPDRHIRAGGRRTAAGDQSRRRGVAQSADRRARPRARHDRAADGTKRLRCRDRRQRARRARDRGLCRLRRIVGGGARCRRLWRPGRRQRADRELSRLSDRHLRPGAGRPRFRAGAEIRRRDHDPDRGQIAGLQPRRRRAGAGSRRRRPDPRTVAGDRHRRPLSPAGDREPRQLTKAAASGTGPRRSKRACARARRSSWSAAAIPPARPRCSCPATPPR